MISYYATWTAFATYPVSSCRVVTMSCARCKQPGTCTRRGPRPTSKSFPTPVTRHSNPALRMSSCSPRIGFADLFAGVVQTKSQEHKKVSRGVAEIAERTVDKQAIEGGGFPRKPALIL